MTAAQRKQRQRARMGVRSDHGRLVNGLLIPSVRECACGCGETFLVGAGQTKQGGGRKWYVDASHKTKANAMAAKLRPNQDGST